MARACVVPWRSRQLFHLPPLADSLITPKGVSRG